jgi:Mitochondrial ribosomal protein (VAR1)
MRDKSQNLYNNVNKQFEIYNQDLNSNSISNSNLIFLKKIYKYRLKGLQEYNKQLSLYLSNSKKKKLLLIKNKSKVDQFSSLNKGLLPIKNLNLKKANEDLLYSKLKNLNKEKNKTELINKYIKSISNINFLNFKELKFSQQINYNFNSVNNIIIKKIYSLLYYSFLSMKILISKPVFKITSDKVIIHLFIYFFKKQKKYKKKYIKTNYIKTNYTFININIKKLKTLCVILSRLFKKPVELDLNRIYYPYFDTNIFVNFLANIINKIRVRKIIKKIFKKAIIKNPLKLNRKIIVTKIPSFLSGIKIKIAGRLLTQRVIPRKTINIVRRGALSRIKINYLDKARYTNKNKRGAFSITITTGQFLT